MPYNIDIPNAATLNCKRCGFEFGHVVHASVEECGEGCKAPHDHHPFEENDRAGYVNVATFDTPEEALAFAQKHWAADQFGRVPIITPAPSKSGTLAKLEAIRLHANDLRGEADSMDAEGADGLAVGLRQVVKDLEALEQAAPEQAAPVELHQQYHADRKQLLIIFTPDDVIEALASNGRVITQAKAEEFLASYDSKLIDAYLGDWPETMRLVADGAEERGFEFNAIERDDLGVEEGCRVCNTSTSLACPFHDGALCANCVCPDCPEVTA